MKPQREVKKLPKWFKVAAISFGLLYLLGFVIIVVLAAKGDQSPEAIQKREERKIEKANAAREVYEANLEYIEWFKEHDAEVRQRLEAYDYAVEQGDRALIREKLNEFWLIPSTKDSLPLKSIYDPTHGIYITAVNSLKESARKIQGSSEQLNLLKEAREKEEKARKDMELKEELLEEERKRLFEDD